MIIRKRVDDKIRGFVMSENPRYEKKETVFETVS